MKHSIVQFILLTVLDIPLISYEEGVSLQHLADDATSPDQKDKLYADASLQYSAVLKCKPYAANALYNLAKCIKGRAMLNEQDKLNLLVVAVKTYQTAESVVFHNKQLLLSIVLNCGNAMYLQILSTE